MDWYDKFKRFLGLHERQDGSHFDNEERHLPRAPHRNDEFEPTFPGRSFNMFTDPLEMHKYFEQQMSEMLKNFGFNEFPDTHQFDLPPIGRFGLPEIPDGDDIPQSGNLRDQYLKPGYELDKNETKEKRDEDVDGKVEIRDWDSVFKGENNSVTPYQREVTPRTHFYGQSVTSKTVRNSDGSVETHHTVRDNQGNEETTITRKVGDKEHSVTIRRDKDGKEETIENLVNMDENEVLKYFPKQPPRVPASDPQSWPFFDRFFR